MKISAGNNEVSRRRLLGMAGTALAAPLYARTSFAASNRELSIFFGLMNCLDQFLMALNVRLASK